MKEGWPCYQIVICRRLIDALGNHTVQGTWLKQLPNDQAAGIWAASMGAKLNIDGANFRIVVDAFDTMRGIPKRFQNRMLTFDEMEVLNFIVTPTATELVQ